MTGRCNTVGLNWNTTVVGLARIRSPWRSRPDNRGWVPFSDKYNDRQRDRYGQTVTDRQRNRQIDVGREEKTKHTKRGQQRMVPPKKKPLLEL